MQVYPGDPLARSEQVASIDTDGFWLHAISMGSQTGTHIDAPSHVVAGAATTDQVPIGRLVALAVVVNVTAVGLGGLVGVEALTVVRERLNPSLAVLFRTGWDAHDGTEIAWQHPGLSAQCAQELAAANVAFVGIDCASVDRHGEVGLPAHMAIAGAGIPIVENLAELRLVDWADPLVVVAPLAWDGLDGAPSRVLALDVEG